MYDDEDEFDEEEEISVDQTEAYETKGAEDRAFVDQQAKDYDEARRKKRAEIAQLNTTRLSAQFKLGQQEQKLKALELAIQKDEYLDTREQGRNEREKEVGDSTEVRVENAEIDLEEMRRTADIAQRKNEYEMLRIESIKLKNQVDDIARQISLLEHELARS